MPWRHFDSLPDATGYSSEPARVAELPADENATNDFRTMEGIFRADLERHTLPHQLQRIAAFLAREGRPILSTEEWLADYYDKYGPAAVLKALWRATEPQRLTEPSDVVEHE